MKPAGRCTRVAGPVAAAVALVAWALLGAPAAPGTGARVLLPATPLADAEHAARRLLAAIGTLRLADWPGLQATCSVSLVATSPAYPGIREWLTAAERALQQAKAAGGNRIEAVR